MNAEVAALLVRLSIAFAVVAGAVLLGWLVNRAIARYVRTRAGGLDPSTITKLHMVERLVRVTLIVAGLLLGLYLLEIEPLRRVAVGVFASAGIVGVALAFAAQTTAANLISGLIIAFVQPLRLGDAVKVDNNLGTVEEIGLFYSRLRTWDNTRVIIPNQVLSKNVIHNYTVQDARHPAVVELRLGYGADVSWAREMLLQEVCVSGLSLAEPEPKVEATAVYDQGITVRVVAWAANRSHSWDLSVLLRERAAARLAEAGIVPLAIQGGALGSRPPGAGPERPAS